MACIREFRPGRFRAEVHKNGTRTSKVFGTHAEASKWAEYVEGALDSRAYAASLERKIKNDMESPILLSSIPKRVLHALSNIPYMHYEIVESSLRYGTGVGIYFLLMEKEVVYVGQTTNLLARLHKHQRDGKIFDAVSFIQCGESHLDNLEAMYIDAFLPEYNRTTGKKDRRSLKASDVSAPRAQTLTGEESQ